MATLKIKHTPVFSKNWDAINDKDIRFIFNQGGSRSSKSYSLVQLLIVYCMSNPNKGVSIVRKTFPTLRGSIMRDFFEVLKELDLYNRDKHSKTEHIYTFDNGSWVEFFSADDEQKLRGRKRDILFCNEANELSKLEFSQLVMRTTDKVLADFNPSDSDHWIYEASELDNAILIKSTYKDNPFLTNDQVDYIENLIKVDPNYYKIYALGERPTSETRIYRHFTQYDTELNNFDDIAYGLDFGFTHPTALIEVKWIGEKVYCKELIYESGLTAQDLINKLVEMNIDKSISLYCDSARPEIIEELRRKGFNKALEANKNVKPGIDKIRSIEVSIHKESINLWREYRNYNWRVLKDRIIDEPVKIDDDAMDAMRYAIYSHSKSIKSIPFFIG
jgi:phage terminase large subunit